MGYILSIFGKIYPGGGGNLSEFVAFGRIAGENAAREDVQPLPPLRSEAGLTGEALAALYLASDASSWVTGENLSITGGICLKKSTTS